MQVIGVNQSRPKARWWLAAIMGAGLLFRLWLWWRVPIHQPANDEVEYLHVARDLVARRGWIFYEQYTWLRAPLYPLFLAGSLLLAHGELRWAALPNIVLSTATIALFYMLAKLVACRTKENHPSSAARATRAGLIAAALCAALLPFATFASLWMSETLFTTLFVAALIVLLRWEIRPAVGLAALAGVLLGLATLTRSLPLAATPLLTLWMLLHRPARQSFGRNAAGAAVCTLALLATLAPWTIRNWIAYGAFIPVETGLSYNLWAFNEPREDLDTISQTLESIPNPAERSALATRKGLERLREDPTILLRRIDFNWVHIWRTKPIEDRFLQASYYEDVPLGIFATSLVLEDVLYLLILTSAAAGLVLAPRSRPKFLLIGWMVYAVVVFLLTHSEGRYRQILYPALIPIAACVLAGLWWQPARRPWRIAAMAAVGLALLSLQYYPFDWAAQNLRRDWAEVAGDRAMRRGDYPRAEKEYRQAADLDPDSADARLKLAEAYDRSGNLARAVKIYGDIAADKPMYVPTSVLWGDALRRAGSFEAARRAFIGKYTDQRAISEWAWAHLNSPAPGEIDVGGGLDIGFVGGMYAPEEADGRTARWTTGSAALRIAAGTQGTMVSLHLAAPRPDGNPVVAEVCYASHCQTIAASALWTTYTFFVPPICATHTSCSKTIEIVFRSPTFVPARAANHASGAEAGDDRHLGLLFDYARAAPLAGTPAPSSTSAIKPGD